MPSVLLTINSTVPAPSEPGSPVLMFYDNGDWEIGFAGDVVSISHNPGFVGAVSVCSILTDLSLEYDGDEIDIAGDRAILFLNVTIDQGSLEEPVIVFWDDGEAEVHERYHAEKMVEDGDGVFNFASVVEFMEELRQFVSNHRTEMFTKRIDDRDPLFFDEDEER